MLKFDNRLADIEKRFKKFGLLEENDELLKFDTDIKPLIGEVDDGKCDLKMEVTINVLKHASLEYIEINLNNN